MNFHITRETYSRSPLWDDEYPSCEQLTCGRCKGVHFLTTFLNRELNVDEFAARHQTCTPGARA